MDPFYLRSDHTISTKGRDTEGGLTLATGILLQCSLIRSTNR